MAFTNFRNKLFEHWFEMCKDAEALFVVDVDGDALYEKYQSAFAPGDNMIYRKRPEHDCSACRHFIKMVGGVVKIKNDFTLETIWGFNAGEKKYQRVCDALDKYVKSFPVKDRFFTKFSQAGRDCDFEQ